MLQRASSRNTRDVVGTATDHQLADVVPKVLFEEAFEALSERVKVFQNPEIAAFFGEGEGVVLCGDSVVGFLHGVFVLIRTKDVGERTIYHRDKKLFGSDSLFAYQNAVVVGILPGIQEVGD